MFTHTTALDLLELKSAIVGNPLVVSQDTTVMDAIAQMSGVRLACVNRYRESEEQLAKTIDDRQDELHLEARSSCVVVVEDGRVVGILTERDVVLLSSQQQPLDRLMVRQVMSHPAITLHEEAFTDLFLAINLLQKHQIRHLPILDEQDRLVGIVTHESLRQIARPIDLLRLRLVAEVMTHEVVCAFPSCSMLAIAQLMANHRISSVIIVEPVVTSTGSLQIPVGIVTERDLVQFQALGLSMETYQAQAVMSTPIFAVKPSDSLLGVQQLMEQRFIRRLVVTGEQGELLGIVTQTSLLQALNPVELYKLAQVLEKKVLRLEAEKISLLESRTIELEQQVEARTAVIQTKAEKEKLVTQIANQIRTSLNLQEILNICVAEVRTFLECDRVLVYQFQPDWSGIIIAESVDPSQPATLGNQINDTYFGQQTATLYDREQPVVVNNIYTTGYSDCHIQLLEQYHVKANLVVPIRVTGQLWGLLISNQCVNYRDWQTEDITLLQHISVQLAIAIQQATTHQQLQQELQERQQAELKLERLNAKLEAKIAQRTQELRQANNLQRAILDSTNYAIMSTDLTGIIQTFNAGAERMLGYSAQEMVGKQTPLVIHDLEELSQRAAVLSIELGQEIPAGLEVFITKTRKDNFSEEEWIYIRKDGSRFPVLLSITPLKNSHEQIIGFVGIAKDISVRKRAENALRESQQFLQTVLDTLPLSVFWKDRNSVYLGGNPQFAKTLGLQSSSEIVGKTDWDFSFTEAEILAFHTDDRQVMESGTAILGREETITLPTGEQRWLETNKMPLRDWKGNVIGILATFQDITERQNALRERKLAEQRMRQQAEREAVLREITQRIRQSLELEVILKAAVNETRQLLAVDRVAVYQFQPNWSGQFIVEAVADNWVKLVDSEIKKVWEDTYLQETQGGRFRHNEIMTVTDIYQAGLQPCHVELLEQFQARAYVVTPIFVGESLWGLFGMYQNTQPYSWAADEIELLQQIANQLAIAIQQASLYEQMQSELVIRQQAEAAMALQLQQQQTLDAITQQIRQSLNLKDILAKVTQQVKDLMNSDRVIVFRLFPNGKSQIVAEAVDSEFIALKDRHWNNESWSQDILDCYWQGKPRIVSDVMRDTWTHCLLEYSVEGQIQSKIVAPILQEIYKSENHRWVAPGENNKLWGILVVHACGEKRVWLESEAQILQQIANQLAIAIQQANLFEQLQLELVERQQAEQQLVESNQQLAISNQELARATRLKDEFLANMSHELRTPLNAILGMTEGLQDKIFGSVNAQQIKALEIIKSSGSHLLELINDILDVAKIESGQLELDCIPTAVTSLCQSSLTFIKQLALKKHIHVEMKLPLNLPDLLVDERRIRQVLINLLNNAVKFTPEGGHITLEVSCHTQKEDGEMGKPEMGGNTLPTSLPPHLPTSSLSQSYLRITIADTGIGIAKENIHKLFQPFVQIDSALNRQYTGTGLGLTLVKRLVELHGGQVSVTSEPGVGSCFTIDLPYTTSHYPSAEPEIPPEPSIEPKLLEPEGSPLILLAEDNEANISTISSYLTAIGYRVIVAKNGSEAIAFVQSENPDLILMDIQMPEMDGLEAIRQIRSNPNLVNVPIIALTALAMMGDRDRCLAAGANDYLTKPVQIKQLVMTIQQLLASRSR
ncbi:GAF domain-containing protein [Phormidium sp. LEGE 05292]|uniref:GAF domain-containing protein n=1 Tax=[Phormidium] sp. LEGE 05292 TaxID=767427 RepID=UPI001882AEB6|nr:GAF domain-containing protein [Phormidium sp. LEGE 05292]MBE9228667.1 GAF domain-containing protein [Phormidium sp. LEGE 05292]